MTLLDGRVALVTGGGRGIGFAVARALGAEGAQIVLNDLGCDRNGQGNDPKVVEDAAEQLRGEGISVLTSPHDVSDREQVAAMLSFADQAVETGELGTIDILVNNAGITADKSIFEMSDPQWDSVIKTHLRGTFLCTQGVCARLRRKKMRGSIVNMTSVSGLLGNLGQANESAAKAGIYGLTRTCSIELQKYGITVNAVAPIARTRLTQELPMFQKAQGTMEPEHIAPAVVYLVSDLAEGLSGTALSVAGGRIATISLNESQGRIKEADEGIWKPAEIAENYASIARK